MPHNVGVNSGWHKQYSKAIDESLSTQSSAKHMLMVGNHFYSI
jgi:hypothetical protein